MIKAYLIAIGFLAYIFSNLAYAEKTYTKSDCIAAVVLENVGVENIDEERNEAFRLIFEYLARYQQPISMTGNAEYLYFFFGFPEGCDRKTIFLNEAIQYYKDRRETPLKYIYVLDEVIEASQDTIDGDYDFITIAEADLRKYQPTECIASIEITDRDNITIPQSDEFFERVSEYLYDNVRSYSLSYHDYFKYYYLFRSPKGCDEKEKLLLEAIENYTVLAEDPIQNFELITTGIEAGESTIIANFSFFDHDVYE